jgi:hypothetical protein
VFASFVRTQRCVVFIGIDEVAPEITLSEIETSLFDN